MRQPMLGKWAVRGVKKFYLKNIYLEIARHHGRKTMMAEIYLFDELEWVLERNLHTIKDFNQVFADDRKQLFGKIRKAVVIMTDRKAAMAIKRIEESAK